VALISGGVVKYEAAACGLASVIVAMVDHQEPVARAFADEGAAEFLGAIEDVETEAATHAIRRLLDDTAARSHLAERARAVVRVDGVERVVAALLGP
jgi:spore coat polysaccharide biosynthesis predicted glycosyltransferase SpsG